jgi:hypothetical protein
MFKTFGLLKLTFSWKIGSFSWFFRMKCFGSENPKIFITVYEINEQLIFVGRQQMNQKLSNISTCVCLKFKPKNHHLFFDFTQPQQIFPKILKFHLAFNNYFFSFWNIHLKIFLSHMKLCHLNHNTHTYTPIHSHVYLL